MQRQPVAAYATAASAAAAALFPLRPLETKRLGGIILRRLGFLALHIRFRSLEVELGNIGARTNLLALLRFGSLAIVRKPF